MKQRSKRKKIGMIVLICGILCLLTALILLFNTSSPMALITLVLSIVLNVVGINVIIAPGR